MNRKIKFRAWHTKQKKMYSAEEMAEDQFTLLTTGYFINVHSGSTELSQIDYDHIMIPLQYTGLKDKNGNEIYEGDIVKADYHLNLGIVEWDNDNAQFIINSSDNISDFELHWKDIEVISNIYENPELLEGK